MTGGLAAEASFRRRQSHDAHSLELGHMARHMTSMAFDGLRWPCRFALDGKTGFKWVKQIFAGIKF